MKVAVTFFNSKRNKKTKDIESILKAKKIKDNIFSNFVKDKVEKNRNNIMIFSSNINIRYILLSIVFATFYYFLNHNTLFLSSNLEVIKSNKINVENFLAMNNLLNKSSYNFKEKTVEIEDTSSNNDYVLLDEIARNYSEVPTFSKIDENDVVVTAQNQIYQKLNVCGIEVVNYSTNRNIDFVDIINSEDIFFSKQKDNILMYTTHTSESYSNSENYTFDYTSAARTTDGNYNMLYIASELASNLKSKGISNICSLTPHDYGEYNSAYINSRTTVSTLLSQNENIALSIDVHRDAIEDLSFAPKVNIRGLDVASLMLVMGIGYDDEPNEYYMDNLKLAFKIQLLANKVYPGLFRQIIIRNSVYNQDLNKYSFLVEVGATGNTIDEAKLATRCLSNLINLLYKD